MRRIESLRYTLKACDFFASAQKRLVSMETAVAGSTFSVVPTGLFHGAFKPRTASWAKFSRPCGTHFCIRLVLT